jgi:dihydrodipicolinate synthase/N-acetylneuraminate lyase
VKREVEILRSKLANGVTPAMATPLHDDGYRVNTAVVPQLVEFLIGAGVKGLFVGGTTGEGILLEPSERRRLHEAAMAAANGRVPVLLHAGANRLDAAMALAEHATRLGADAIAAVTPYYYGMDDDGLAAYYKAIADVAGETPLLLYDIPHMAVNGISPGLLARLCNEIPTLAGMKSSRRDAQEVRQLMAAAPDGFIMLAGNESVALGLLALGVDGLISGMSTAIPEPFVALTRDFGDGDLTSARRQQQLINQLLSRIPAGKRIGAIKRILSERGVHVGPAVPPRPMPDEPIWPRLATLLGETV